MTCFSRQNSRWDGKYTEAPSNINQKDLGIAPNFTGSIRKCRILSTVKTTLESTLKQWLSPMKRHVKQMESLCDQDL